MNEFEDELRTVLRRKEPPAGFATRVTAQTGSKTRRGGRGWVAGAIAACVLLAAGGFEYRQYEGRKAGRDLRAALEIAGAKLNIAEKEISELNQRSIHE